MEDVGPIVPYARKHLAQSSGVERSASLNLKGLWPEPDWMSWVQEGCNPQTVALLACTYWNIAKSPRANCAWKISDQEWSHAYQQAIQRMIQLFERARHQEPQCNLADQWALECGIDRDRVMRQHPKEVMLYWSLGRTGKKKLSTPFGLSSRLQYLKDWMVKLGWPGDDSVLKTNIIPISFEGGRLRVCRMVGERLYFESDWCESEAQAIALAKAASFKALSLCHELKRRPGSATEDRTGPDRRAGVQVSPEAILQTFGIRALQFGASLPDSEASAWVNHLYEALHDFSDLMGCNPRWLGLRGLSIAIGARGQAGVSAAAHYETAFRVVNFTRANGAGSLAHEWAHALDHYLSHYFVEGGKIGMSYLTQVNYLVAPEDRISRSDCIVGAFDDLRQAMCNSTYARQARAIEQLPRARKGYWQDPVELFARAFEAWIEDKLVAAGRASPYLVFGTLEAHWVNKASTSPYPLGADRRRFNDLFAALIRAMMAK